MDIVTIDVQEDDPDAVISRVREISSTRDAVAQAIDPAYVAGEDHLARAWEMVERAQARGREIADDPAMEWLLYIAGTRQIDRALTLGIGAETDVAAVVIAGENATAAAEDVRTSWSPADAQLGDPATLREWFGISAEEEAATTAPLEALVCERVVLLQLEA